MEFSKLKLEIYDLAAIIIPGLLCLAEGMCTLYGFAVFMVFLRALTASEFTLILICSFALGQLVQEAADRGVKALKGPRFLKQARDSFWKSAAAEPVKAKILSERGTPLDAVDLAYDYCLTCIGDRFAKRDTFVAVSDLSRCLWFLSVVAVVPLAMSVGHLEHLSVKVVLAGRGLFLILLSRARTSV